MELGQLPNEILETIFRFLDGASLSRSRRTCVRWNALISNLQRCGSCSWKTSCLREMDSDVLMDMLGCKTIDSEGQGEEVWWNTYVAFHRTQRMAGCQRLVKKIPLREDINRIVCIKVSRDCLITGNACGNVWLWDTAFGEVVQPLCKHLKIVTDIVLVDLFNLGMYNAMDCLTAHHHVITCGKDRTLKMTPLQFCKDGTEFVVKSIAMPGSIHVLRIFDNVLMARCQNGEIYIWKMSMITPSSTVIELLALSVSEDNLPMQCRWAGLWQDEISVIDSTMDRYTFNVKKNEWTSLTAPTLQLMVTTSSDRFDSIVIKRCFLFHGKTIIFITVDGYLGVSVDGHRYAAYSTLDSLKSHVTTVKIHCNLLVLGTSIGGIFVYLNKKKEDLLDLKLHEPLWSKAYSSSAIISIDMWLSGKKIVLAAVTDDDIYAVQWIPKSNHLPLNGVI